MNIAPPPVSRRTTSMPCSLAYSKSTSSAIDWNFPQTTAGAAQSQILSVACRSPFATCVAHSSSTCICSAGMRGMSTTVCGFIRAHRRFASCSPMSMGAGSSPDCARSPCRVARASRIRSNSRSAVCADSRAPPPTSARTTANAIASPLAPISVSPITPRNSPDSAL